MALANLMPVDDAQDELDSYMYQTVSILIDSICCLSIFVTNMKSFNLLEFGM